MAYNIKGQKLGEILRTSLEETDFTWIQDNLKSILDSRETSKLYLVYSLLGSRISHQPVILNKKDSIDTPYLVSQAANQQELARLYLLIEVLESDFEFYSTKVSKIIELADRSELITFLKYLVLLPNADHFKSAAVEALRTNITPVFEAISMNNPYPAKYFNDQQWNQMYLKAAFMQLNLADIVEVEERSNAELARIISDYAHERWAASRQIDPMIWRPVSNFLNENLLSDMERLLNSNDPIENKAAALCCFKSGDEIAINLLETNKPEILEKIEANKLDWKNIKT